MPRDFTPCPVISAAAMQGNVTRQLLCALSRHERDSELGLLAQAILDASPGANPTDADFDAAENAAGMIRHHADALAEEYEGEIADDRQPQMMGEV